MFKASKETFWFNVNKEKRLFLEKSIKKGNVAEYRIWNEIKRNVW